MNPRWALLILGSIGAFSRLQFQGSDLSIWLMQRSKILMVFNDSCDNIIRCFEIICGIFHYIFHMPTCSKFKHDDEKKWGSGAGGQVRSDPEVTRSRDHSPKLYLHTKVTLRSRGREIIAQNDTFIHKWSWGHEVMKSWPKMKFVYKSDPKVTRL